MNEVELTLAMAKYDATCKELLSNKQIAGLILKFVSKSDDTNKICRNKLIGNHNKCQALQTNFKKLPGEHQREINCDLIFGTTDHQSILHIEAQDDYSTYWLQKFRPKRYFDTLKAEAFNILGIDEDQNYQKEIIIYSVWILLFPPNEKKGIIEESRMYSLTNQYGKETFNPSKFKDSITTFYLDSNIHFNGNTVFEVLCIIFSTKLTPKIKIYLLDKLYDIQLIHSESEAICSMCNFSIGFLNEGKRIGKEEGLKQGIIQGFEKGVEKGIEKGKKDTIYKMLLKYMSKTNCSIYDALAYFDIEKEDYKIFLEMLEIQ